MQSLSLAIIMKDVEKTLQKCLDSAAPVVDEIIVVDTGSTDRSKEIALQYTSKVYDFPWIDDFSAARNFSFDLCTKEYIFWIDADDEILKKDQEKIKNLDLSDKEIVLCQYQYSHDQFGVPECTLERERIIKRSLGLKWEKPIHEYLPISGKKISRQDIEIHHWKQHGTSERNLKILERIIQKDPDSRNFYYLGKEYADFGRFEEAIETLEKFVTMKGWWEDVFCAHDTIAKCYLVLKNEKKFFENIFRSIEIEPRRAEPYFELGDYYFSKNDWGKAAHYFDICLNVKRPKELMSTYYPQNYTWRPALMATQAYNNLGAVQTAFERSKLFLKYRPNDQLAINNYNCLLNSSLRFVKKDGQSKKLNLGCGNKRIEGYINVDIVKIPEVDEVFNFYEIPYQDNTISTISSEHALEHVSADKAKQAIKEWFRVLEPGGKLELYIPDLELCAKGYVEGDNSRTINGFKEKNWYKMTLYGAQRPENGSDAEHQFHLNGFSKDEIKELLEEAGFIITHLRNY
ncbi:MAG: glycosyltransferase [Candidatus Nanoarchaeia archaeon]|jgi:predicted SAM-dependent methyltransferase|nr:glycosyltransferase [Candidatus Nanoarchaeia archaeon]